MAGPRISSSSSLVASAFPSILRHCARGGAGVSNAAHFGGTRACRLALSHFNVAVRRSVVTQITPTLSHLRSDSTENDVFLVGTAHISQSSADEVQHLIRDIRPDKVFVELDPARAARLRHGDGMGEDQFENAMKGMLAKLGGMPGLAALPGFGGGAGFGGAGGAGADMLGGFFKAFYSLLRKYGYIPGVEMLAAMNEADAVESSIVYGDRDASDTMRELSAALLNPATLMGALTKKPPPELEQMMQHSMSGGLNDLGDRVEALKTRENAALMTKWMEESMPDVADVMIRRRDLHMARNLRDKCGSGKVVAVVGMAHVDGIEREWQELGSSSVKSLPSS